MSQFQRRQLDGLPALTPDQLSQIHYGDKSELASLLRIVCGISISLISTIVILRLVVRRSTAGRFFLDDALIIFASLFTVVVCSVALAATRSGLGQHVWNLPMRAIIPNLKRTVQLMFVGNIFYALAIAFTKLSIIASYMHLLRPAGAFKVILYVTGVVTIGLVIASVPATIFQCSPIWAAWDFTFKEPKCYVFLNFLYASTAVNIVTDLVLCTVPIPLFWSLHLPVRQKMLVSVLFFLGGFACVATIIRIAYLHLLDGRGIDITYDLVNSLVWTIAECTIGIVCVSMPALRPVLAKLVPSLFKSRWGTQRSAITSRPKPFDMASSKTSKVSTGGRTESGPDEIELVKKESDPWDLEDSPVQLARGAVSESVSEGVSERGRSAGR